MKNIVNHRFSPLWIGLGLLSSACGVSPDEAETNGGPADQAELVATAESALTCGKLAAGESLARGQSIKSCDGRATLIHQTDGNVVLYDQAGALWTTNTAGRSDTTSLVMQGDGNLVLYASTGAIWYSNTAGNAGAALAIQDDCNLVIYSSAGRVLWTSSTFCRVPTNIDLYAYMTPGCAAAGTQYSTQVTGARWYIPKGKDASGRKQFIYVKGTNGADYEAYTADESWIRLWKDTSWAYFDDGLQTYCDEQCGVLNQATTCKHQWRGDPTPSGYAYQAPKDTGDWGGAKVLPRYFNPSLGVQTFTFNIFVDAQSETSCGACDSWHEGNTWQKYTVQLLSSVTAPNGTVYNNVIKKVIIDGAGKNEVYYFAYGKGWIGYEVLNSTYKDWVTGTTTGVSYPTTCTSGGASSSC